MGFWPCCRRRAGRDAHGDGTGKKHTFFSLGKTYEEIQEIGIEDLTFEENVLRKEEKERLLQEFSNME